MAKFRKVEVEFWNDTFIENLSPEDKYFLLFLMTNPETTECGIYSITKKKMAYYTGYNIETINNLIRRFSDYEKIFYDEAGSEIVLLDKMKLIENTGKPVLDCIKSELKKVKNRELIGLAFAEIENKELQKLYKSL